MYAYNILIKSTLASLLFLGLHAQAGERVGKCRLAEKITAKEMKAWDISVFPDGKNLPEGSGDYKSGKALYDAQCMACHGENGKGGVKLDPYRGAIDTLVKSKGDSLTSDAPKKNIGTYWQYAPLLFDYMRRTMPYQAPKSLSADELYALTAYLLAENGIITKETVLNQDNLAKVKMPNIDGFICDNHVDTKSVPCMKNCPLAGEKDFNKWVEIDHVDHLKSDCLVQPDIKLEGE